MMKRSFYCEIIAGWVEELACHQETSTYHSWFSRSGVQ